MQNVKSAYVSLNYLRLSTRFLLFYISCSNTCKYQTYGEMQSCPNISCLTKQESSVVKQLNLQMDISDVSGGMQSLRLMGNIAEKVVGYTVRYSLPSLYRRLLKGKM